MGGMTEEQLQERIILLEKALTLIGMGQSRCVEPPEFRWIHREYIEHALKMVDIQSLYAKYPDIAREVIYPLQTKR